MFSHQITKAPYATTKLSQQSKEKMYTVTVIDIDSLKHWQWCLEYLFEMDIGVTDTLRLNETNTVM